MKFIFKGSPSRPNLPNSPPQANVRHVVMQNSLIDPNSNASSGGSMITHHQMAFEYNQNSANGLELAGFCSPSGKLKIKSTNFDWMFKHQIF